MAINVDEAALDAFLANDGQVETPQETAPEGSAPETTTESQADVEHEIPETLPEGDTFKREYVEKLRRESANYRDRAKKYSEAFDGYEDEAVQEWLSLAAQMRQDPKAVAGRFSELAEAINRHYSTPEEPVTDNDPDLSDNQPMTRQEFERMWAEKERQKDLDRRVAKIERDAEDLGYQRGSDAYDNLLWRASRLQSGSVQEAHDHIKRERQAVIDAYVAELGGQPNPRVPQGGAAPSTERKLDNFEDASAALDAWLASQA